MALTDNLLAHYNLDGNSNDNFGTNNGTDVSIDYSISYGIINQGALFNATTDKISLSNWGLGTADFSVSLWFKPITSLVNGTNLVFCQNASGTNVYWGLIINTGKFEINHFNGSTDNFFFGSTSISLNTWYHLVVVRSGDTVTLYVNNAVDGSLTGYSGRNFSGAILNGFGNQLINAARGHLDEVWVLTRAITAGEVSQLYNGGAGLTYPIPSASQNSNFFLAM